MFLILYQKNFVRNTVDVVHKGGAHILMTCGTTLSNFGCYDFSSYSNVQDLSRLSRSCYIIKTC